MGSILLITVVEQKDSRSGTDFKRVIGVDRTEELRGGVLGVVNDDVFEIELLGGVNGREGSLLLGIGINSGVGFGLTSLGIVLSLSVLLT